MYKELHKLIKKYQTIIIHRHSDPDGDAIGSQVALKEILKINFPHKKIYIVGDEVERFINLGAMDKINDSLYKNALAIVLDSGDEKLISDSRYKLAPVVVKIDHHLSGTNYGHLNIVETDEISCASLLTKIVLELGYRLNKLSAQALYLGIVADSNRFLYRGVNSQTFYLTSKLMEYDFSIDEVYEVLYSKSLDYVLLRAQMTLRFKITSRNVAYLMTSKKERDNLGIDFFSLSRGMVSIMSGINGINIWVNFTEDDEGGIVAELRSNKFNINPVAVKYGGGGHAFASGAYLNSFDKANELLLDLDKIMEEAK